MKVIEAKEERPVVEAKTYSLKQRKAAEQAIKSRVWKFDESEIAADNFSYVGLSNTQMADLMSDIDPKYDYEVLSETEKHGMMKVTHHVLVRTLK